MDYHQDSSKHQGFEFEKLLLQCEPPFSQLLRFDGNGPTLERDPHTAQSMDTKGCVLFALLRLP
eukprot:1806070-Amphidinium_carterae.2